MRVAQTEVVVVGAGPVGLYLALVLAEAGIELIVVDQEERTTARSYACALHPSTLKLFKRLGLADALVERGRPLKKIAFYEGDSRQAELTLGQTSDDSLLVLPQDALESALEQRLRDAGVAVRWNHRCDDLAEEDEIVSVTIEELGGTGTGYIVPHWESMVKNSSSVRAQFLLGTDGHNSLVRQRLGLDYERHGEPEVFAVFEFESDGSAPDEVRVVLDAKTTNVLWPLPANKCRWTFQLLHSDPPRDFPEKERRGLRLSQPEVDERVAQYIKDVARRRAPWFSSAINQISWCSEVAFEHRLAKSFGRGRCWLAGDAAHQTGPVGIQSMNAGFFEAEQLAALIRPVLRDGASLDSLRRYDQERQAEWRRLLGLTASLEPTGQSLDWVKNRRHRLMSCLPGLSSDLPALFGQLGLDFGTK